MKEYHYTINGHAYDVTIHSTDEEVAEVEVNGSRYTVQLGEQATPATPKPQPKVEKAEKPKAAPAPTPEPEETKEEAPAAAPKKAAGAGKEVIAPLPGLIREILVKEGDAVTKGQKLMILEAMKMENEINADADGTITSLLVAEGDSVQGGDPLLTIG
jgi:biotin carboxyl carrier protein